MNATSPAKRLRIGTRGSALALAQAAAVSRALATSQLIDASEIDFRIIKTTGDRIQDRALADLGGKGLFTKEIEEALLDGAIDIAVHSAKDMPAVLPSGLIIAAYLEREDVRDVLISRAGSPLGALPHGSRLGTGSLRREAQARRLRPDLDILPLRGNIHTRLYKVATGELDAIILAMAGLNRLAIPPEGRHALSVDEFLPAVGQGGIAIEMRAADRTTSALLAAINHWPTYIAISAERAFLAELDGSCRTPIAGYAVMHGSELRLRGMMVQSDGAWCEVERTGECAHPEQLGHRAGADLRQRAGATPLLEAT
jgi:hydroxymethylbilane synthase